MYLLDTNVVSELRKVKIGRANHNVVAWARSVSPSMLFLSVITVLELEQGVLAIERRDVAQGALLRGWLDQAVLPTFADRILPIDTSVALRCAQLHVPDPRAERDALIAATALVHGQAVVTRNGGDFVSSGVQVVDPWVGDTVYLPFVYKVSRRRDIKGGKTTRQACRPCRSPADCFKVQADGVSR